MHAGNLSSWAADDNKNGAVVVNEEEMNEESCLDITVHLNMMVVQVCLKKLVNLSSYNESFFFQEDVVAVNKHLKVAEGKVCVFRKNTFRKCEIGH